MMNKQHRPKKPKPDATKVKIGSRADLKKEVSLDEHKIPLEELCARLGTNTEVGLSTKQVAEKRKTFGWNELTPPTKPSKLMKLLRTLFTGFSALLWLAVVLCVGAFIFDLTQGDGDQARDNIIVAGVLTLSILVSSFFDFYQENKSSNIMETFAKMIPKKTIVVREGVQKEVEVRELVPGDIVEMKGGNSVPADTRIIIANNFKVDNSSLTGESEPQERSVRCTNENEPLQTANLAFFSTNAVEGNARGIVISTGDHTVMGEIATLTSTMEEATTPLAKEIDRFVYAITIVSLVFAAVIFLVAHFYGGFSLTKSGLLFVGVLVGNVPQGLLITVTVCLMLIAQKMSENNCLVKNLHAVETLGSTSVICTDKTGTITLNKMTVTHFWHDQQAYTFHAATATVTPYDAATKDERKDEYDEMTREALLRAAALCNRAEFEINQDDIPINERKCTSDATESALFRCVEAITHNVPEWRQRNHKVGEIPFNSTTKYQLSVHVCDNPADGYFLVAKGAPEIIFEMCATMLVDGEEIPITQQRRQEFLEAYEFLGSLGERVLGFCDFDLPTADFPEGYIFNIATLNFPTNGVRFLGLISLIDPPRASVPPAVAKCRSAGIKVVMVTGDHPTTATAIAKAAGIITQATRAEIAMRNDSSLEEVDPSEVKAIVVEGSDLKKMSDEELTNVLMNHHEIVFARTSPKQKLRIVEGFQKQGAIVAVTGDGVNDSPALKKADVGIAMGITGSDVSKQVADIILLDDNFASIVTGVEAGRTVFDNLKKSIVYTLTSKVPEMLPFLMFALLGIPPALATVTILCIDLGTDLWPAISLAYEKAEPDIMKRPPRNLKKDRLVNTRLVVVAYGQIGMIQAAAGFFAYFVVMANHGFAPVDLLNMQNRGWNNKTIILEDSRGRLWDYASRMILERTCHTAYFFAIVVMQWSDLLISKTRRSSIVQQGLDNWVLNSGLVFMTVVATVLSLTPLHHYVGMEKLKFWWWMPAIPFAILLFCWDETRKMLIRRGGAIGRFMMEQTYY